MDGSSQYYKLKVDKLNCPLFVFKYQHSLNRAFYINSIQALLKYLVALIIFLIEKYNFKISIFLIAAYIYFSIIIFYDFLNYMQAISMTSIFISLCSETCVKYTIYYIWIYLRSIIFNTYINTIKYFICFYNY